MDSDRALAVGVMTSVSRTPLIVLAAAGLVLLWLRPRDVKKLLPLLVPLIVVVKLALPGSLATVKELSSRRAASWLSTLRWRPKPIRSWPADAFGCSGRVSAEAAGRRCSARASERDRRDSTTRSETLRSSTTSGSARSSSIGIVGVVGWAALLYWCGAAAQDGQSRRRAGPDGWLFAGFAAAIVGFAVAMFTFDAMAFVQVTFVLWVLVGLGASLLLAEQEQEQGGVTGRAPTISIGLPVRNARDVVGRCLDSILSQDVADLELVVSDNASEDGTQELLADYASPTPGSG